MTKINKTQKIIFDLMKVSSFSNFNGERVVQDLMKNREKWIGAIWGRFIYFTMLPLRDIQNDIYNADTLYLSVPKKYVEDIETLAKSWKADEIGYFLNGELKGIYDENLIGLKGEGIFKYPLGASPEKDIAYFRIWWD